MPNCSLGFAYKISEDYHYYSALRHSGMGKRGVLLMNIGTPKSESSVFSCKQPEIETSKSINVLSIV